MATRKKTLKSHTSPQKKSSALSAKSSRTKKAVSKAAKTRAAKKKAKDLEDRKKLMEMTLKMFQTVYDDYQQGKFHRIL